MRTPHQLEHGYIPGTKPAAKPLGKPADLPNGTLVLLPANTGSILPRHVAGPHTLQALVETIERPNRNPTSADAIADAWPRDRHTVHGTTTCLSRGDTPAGARGVSPPSKSPIAARSSSRHQKPVTTFEEVLRRVMRSAGGQGGEPRIRLAMEVTS